MKNQSGKSEKYSEILNLKDDRELLNCHPNTLWNWDWDSEGMLKAIRFSRRGDRRYKKTDILKIIKN